jgi:hypothetical protein
MNARRVAPLVIVTAKIRGTSSPTITSASIPSAGSSSTSRERMRRRARQIVEVTPGVHAAMMRIVELALRERWTRAQLERAGRRLAKHCPQSVRLLSVPDGLAGFFSSTAKRPDRPRAPTTPTTRARRVL